MFKERCGCCAPKLAMVGKKGLWMNLQPLTRILSCFAVMVFAGVPVQAAPLKLPANAIAGDTFLVATVDLAKANPAILEASAKAVLGEKAGKVDSLLSGFKTHYEKYAGKGAESVTVVLRYDPDPRKGFQPIFYVKFKPGADHAAVEKQIREEEGENNPAALEISHDGDFMVLRQKGLELPSAGSEERTKLFAEALGDSDKPVIGALIFNDAMVKGLREDVGHGAPPGLVPMATDSKWLRMEMTLGEAVKMEVTIQTADEEAGKRVADAVTGLGDFIKAQIAAQMKQAAAQADPHFGEFVDAMTAIAEAFKPQQTGTKVTVTADAKAVGGMLRTFGTAQTLKAENVQPLKGGNGGL